jgi:hypothetical protein
MAQGNIDIAVRLKNSREFVGDSKKVATSIDGIERSADKTDRTTRRTAGATGLLAGGLKGIAGGAAAAIGAYVGLDTAVRVLGDSINLSTSVGESLSKNEVLFGRSAKAVKAFSDSSALSFGISQAAALEYTGVFGNLFRAVGVGEEASAKSSVALTKLASDLASFNNTSIEDALEALRSGLVGETEPLRRFGVNINDAQLRTAALRLGLIKTTKDALTPQQKALAAQALIFRQTSKAQGDFARTSGGLANQQRILSAQISDAKVKLGDQLRPAMLSVVRTLTRFIRQMRTGKGAGGEFSRTMKDVWSVVRDVGGVLRWVVGRVKTAVSTFKKMRVLREIFKQVFDMTPLGSFIEALRAAKSAFEDIKQVVQDPVGALRGLLPGGSDGIGRRQGGRIGFAGGGYVPGARVSADTVPAMLSPGEFVVTGSGERILERMTGVPGVLNFVGRAQRAHFGGGGRVNPVPVMGGGAGRPIVTKVYLDRRQIAEAVGSEFADRQARR